MVYWALAVICCCCLVQQAVAVKVEVAEKYEGPCLRISKKFSMFKIGDMFGEKKPFVSLTVDSVTGQNNYIGILKQEEYLRLFEELDPVITCKKGNIGFLLSKARPGLSQTRSVNSTGLYSIVHLVCEPSVEIHLTLESMNPFGQLTGGFVLLLPVSFRQFHIAMSIVYLVFLTFWACSLLNYYQFSINIQKFCIPGILMICMFEHSINFWYWEHINLTGKYSNLLLILSIATKSLRDSVGRCLLLAASYGWGIVDDNPPYGNRIIYFCGFFYFIFDAVYETVNKVYLDNELWVIILSTLPLVLINSLIFYFVFAWFVQVYMRLKLMAQSYKIELFRKFACVLFVGGLVSVLWTIIEILTKSFLLIEDYWTGIWLYTGIWDLIFMLMTVSFMIIWKIDEKSQFLAQAYQIRSEDDLESEKEEKYGVELVKIRK